MELYRQYAQDLSGILEQMAWADVEQVVQLLQRAWLAGAQVFVMGNGGSASTASHVACDLSKNTLVPLMPRLRVISLNDNMATFSAYANDNGYESVFAEQLSTLARPNDVVLAISASGNSPNVLKGIEAARSAQATTVGWSGYQGGMLAQMVDIPIVVPSNCIEQIEDLHLILGHMVTTALRQAMQRVPALRSEPKVVTPLELYTNNSHSPAPWPALNQ